jgi:hypothetical protein
LKIIVEHNEKQYRDKYKIAEKKKIAKMSENIKNSSL